MLVSEGMSVKQELKQIKTTFMSKLIVLSCLWAFWSFFYRSVTLEPTRHSR